jgi:hypothetical protein
MVDCKTMQSCSATKPIKQDGIQRQRTQCTVRWHPAYELTLARFSASIAANKRQTTLSIITFFSVYRVHRQRSESTIDLHPLQKTRWVVKKIVVSIQHQYAPVIDLWQLNITQSPYITWLIHRLNSRMMRFEIFTGDSPAVWNWTNRKFAGKSARTKPFLAIVKNRLIAALVAHHETCAYSPCCRDISVARSPDWGRWPHWERYGRVGIGL